jgi:hypothetical protein
MLCDSAKILGDITRFMRKHGDDEGIVPTSLNGSSSSSSDAATVGGRRGMGDRAVARIFHGLHSPYYPAYMWNRTAFWGLHKTADFQLILTLAERVVERAMCVDMGAGGDNGIDRN